jgi:hypothetical protein
MRQVFQIRAVGLAAGMSVVACTGHGDTKPTPKAQPQGDAPLAAVELPPAPEASPWPCTYEGPVTALELKPFRGALGDVTGDGQPDVVALSFLNGPEAGLVVLTGQRDGRFIEGAPQPVDAGGIALGDLDGDADLDALLVDGGGKPAYQVATNDGTGVFALGRSRRIPGRFGGELQQASLADLDDDGDLDAVIPLWDSLRVMNNRGRGRFEPGQRLLVGRDPFMTTLADFDGDGHLDLVVTSGAGIEPNRGQYHPAGAALWVYRGGPRGFSTASDSLTVAGASQVAVADLDADGFKEIVVTRSGGITVFGDPRLWASSKRWPPAPAPASGWMQGEDKVPIKLDTDGRLLVADLGGPAGPELITSSYMLGRLNIVANDNSTLETSSIDTGSFVVGMYPANVAGDATRPDIVLLNAGPPGPPFGDPAPSISGLFVDCAAVGG